MVGKTIIVIWVVLLFVVYGCTTNLKNTSDENRIEVTPKEFKIQNEKTQIKEKMLDVFEGKTSEGSYFKGDKNAPVDFVIFTDFSCPFCSQFFTNISPKIVKNYVDTGKIKIIHKNFPLDTVHPEAISSAVAAECAGEQGKFWVMHDQLFNHQKELSKSRYKQWAQEIELNSTQFNGCLDTEKYIGTVKKERKEGEQAGIQGVPSFFINGDLISGTHPYNVFEDVIDDAISVSKKALNGEVMASEKPFLWMIEGKKPSYLYGTIHVADGRVLTLPTKVVKALEDSDILYTEVGLDEKNAQDLIKASMLPPEKSLETLLSTEIYLRLDKYLSSKGISILSFSNLKLWVLANSLAIIEYQRENIGKESLDHYLYARMNHLGKKTEGLESIAGHVGAFDSLTTQEQLIWLNQSLTDIEERAEEGRNLTEELLLLYLKGDLNKLLLIGDISVENNSLEQKLNLLILTKRNRVMAERISKIVHDQPEKGHFFAIGAAHYPNEEGIISILHQQGFIITQVPLEVNESCSFWERSIKGRCYLPYEYMPIED